MTFPQSDPTAPQPGPDGTGYGYSDPSTPVPPTQPLPYGTPPGLDYGAAQPGYPPPYPAAYPPYYHGYNPSAQTNTMAILSLVFAFVFSPLGIVFGHIARKQIRERGEGGSGLATAGLICSYVFTALGLVACIGYGVLIATVVNSSQSTY